MDLPMLREWFSCSLTFGFGDRTRLVMHEPPHAGDPAEVVARRECQHSDYLDTKNAPFIATDNGMGFVTYDRRSSRIFKNVAPAAHHRDPSNDRGPSRMNAGDGVIIRP